MEIELMIIENYIFDLSLERSTASNFILLRVFFFEVKELLNIRQLLFKQ